MITLTTSRALITGACLLALYSPLAGQSSGAPRNGDWVRLETMHAGNLQGRLLQADRDSVVLSVGQDDRRFAVARTSVRNVWVSLGQKRQTLRGVGIGFAAGAIGGGVIGAISYSPCESTGFMSCFMAPESAGQAALLGGVAGGFFGTIIGGVAGFATKRHVWEVAGVPTTVGFTTTRDGATLSLRIAL